MTELPMFPLGSVLFPHMPLLLRVFEDRYLVLLSTILEDEPSEFGVTLIERGQEVGGGEKRFSVGTVAQITQMDSTEGFIVLVAEGERRISVTEWLEDDPFPRASITELEPLVWDDAHQPLRDRAEAAVRRVLSLASEFVDQTWPADIALADDPVAAVWQLAAIAPLTPLDQVVLLGSTTVPELLEKLLEFANAAEETLRSPLTGSDDEADNFDDGDSDDGDSDLDGLR